MLFSVGPINGPLGTLNTFLTCVIQIGFVFVSLKKQNLIYYTYYIKFNPFALLNYNKGFFLFWNLESRL